MKIPDSVTSALLEAWPVARLATLGGDGAPHQVPIVFAQAGGALWSPIDGKPKRAALPQRVANLERDARASLLLDHYDENWTRLWWLRLEATASIRPLEPADDEAQAALLALRAKYSQYLETPIVSERRLLIRLEVQRVSSWCGGPEALERRGWCAIARGRGPAVRISSPRYRPLFWSWNGGSNAENRHFHGLRNCYRADGCLLGRSE